MCGRTACTLPPDCIVKACKYKNTSNEYKIPEWKEHENGGRTYKPSSNTCPTHVTPVLVQNANEGPRTLEPMVWGMIPPWYRGEKATSHGMSTNNCRVENVMTSKLYKTPLLKGQRCVVICDGFYEWQTTVKKSKKKQPYFIYSSQNEHLKVEEMSSLWQSQETGPKLLFLAGIFDKWVSSGETVYSYSIITMESDSVLNWLHHRTPAILSEDEQISQWLNPNLQCSEALSVLTPKAKICWHMVGFDVNNARCQLPGLNKPITPENESLKKKSKSASLMENWLTGAKKRKGNEDA